MFVLVSKVKLIEDKWFREVQEKEKIIAEVRKERDDLEKKLTEQFKFEEKKATAALEDRLAKEKLEMERDFNNKMAKFKEEELGKMYDKLSSSLTKLHEEGNTNTRFIQDMNKEFMKAFGDLNTPRLTDGQTN